MTRQKSKFPEEVERQRQEAIMFGKMCGCEECQYCEAWRVEKVWLSMQKMIEEERKRPNKWEDVKW